MHRVKGKKEAGEQGKMFRKEGADKEVSEQYADDSDQGKDNAHKEKRVPQAQEQTNKEVKKRGMRVAQCHVESLALQSIVGPGEGIILIKADRLNVQFVETQRESKNQDDAKGDEPPVDAHEKTEPTKFKKFAVELSGVWSPEIFHNPCLL